MFAGLDESAVRLCAPDDADALADALRALVSDADTRAALGQGALAMRAEMGDWGAAAAATLGVYEQTIQRAGKR